MKVIVFDLGGTLMQYVGMPHSWVEFYHQGFDAIRWKFDCQVTEDNRTVHTMFNGNESKSKLSGGRILAGGDVCEGAFPLAGEITDKGMR